MRSEDNKFNAELVTTECGLVILSNTIPSFLILSALLFAPPHSSSYSSSLLSFASSFILNPNCLCSRFSKREREREEGEEEEVLTRMTSAHCRPSLSLSRWWRVAWPLFRGLNRRGRTHRLSLFPLSLSLSLVWRLVPCFLLYSILTL